MAPYIMIALLWALAVWLLSSPGKRSFPKAVLWGLTWPALMLVFLVSTVAWVLED